MHKLVRGVVTRCSHVRIGHSVAWVLFAVLAVSLPVHAIEGPYIGLNLGASKPTNNNYRAHVENGASGSPYGGYMFNDYLGVQGEVQGTFQYPDNDHRGFKGENQVTTLLGVLVGPRLQLPLGEELSPAGHPIEFYLTGQGGFFTGLSGRLSHTSSGVSAGGGMDIYLTDQLAFSLFGRWNRAYQSPRPTFLAYQLDDQQGPADATWAIGGVGFKYNFNRPAPPPPPPTPQVAQAPPPPPPPAKKKIVLRSVHFDFDKAVIRADAKPVLDEAVQILKEEGGVAVIVAGHTDSIGTEAYNLKLSERRANAVRDYLIEHGIAASRITAEGLGESQPVASNDTADGRAQNRRVELHVKE